VNIETYLGTQVAVLMLFTMLKSAQNDWQLRGSFFDCIVGVAAYVGWQSSIILKPLLQQVCLYVHSSVYSAHCLEARRI